MAGGIGADDETPELVICQGAKHRRLSHRLSPDPVAAGKCQL